MELLGQFQSQPDVERDVFYMFLHPFSMSAIARGHRMQLFPVPRLSPCKIFKVGVCVFFLDLAPALDS